LHALVKKNYNVVINLLDEDRVEELLRYFEAISQYGKDETLFTLKVLLSFESTRFETLKRCIQLIQHNDLHGNTLILRRLTNFKGKKHFIA
jgi:hypothetical protein